LKVDYAANSGAVGVLIGLVAPGDAVSFSNGGGSNFVPTLVIIQSTANTLKTALSSGSVNGTIGINNAISTASNVASYSSRGPNYSYNMLKPDMSAPGTMTAALVGSGSGQATESGTSFACPITAGSAALLLSANHSLTPVDIKARLMATTSPTVYQNVLTQPGVLAPLSRVGSGELRVDKAYGGTLAAWDASNPLAVSLSFGTYRLAANQTFSKKVAIHNYSNVNRTLTISNTYRDAPNNTGVTLTFPSTVLVPANGTATVALSLKVTPASLPSWTLNGGKNGGTGSLLQTVEYAGLLNFSDSNDSANLAWHILPHQAANVVAATSLSLGGNVTPLPLTNSGAPIAGPTDVFSLTGTGTQFPASVLPAPGSSYAVINLRAVGVRLVCVAGTTSCTGYGVQVAVNTFGQRAHPDVPAEFDVNIDADNDGVDDYVIYNEDIGLATTGTSTGQNGVFVANLITGTASGPYFYTSADLNSANAIFTAPLSALTTTGKPSVTINSPFTFSVLAFDNYYTGNLTDIISGMKYELDMPKYYTSSSFSVPAGFSGGVNVYPNDATTPYFSGPYNGNSPSQTGLLLMYTHGRDSREADVVTVTP